MVFRCLNVIWLFHSVLLCLAEDGVVFTRQRGSGSGWVDHFCIDYNPGFSDLPSQQAEAIVYPLSDLSASVACNETAYRHDVNKTVVLVARGECSFSLKASLAQEKGAAGLLIASDVLLSPGAANVSVDYDEINITVATILWSDVHAFQAQGNNTEVLIYAPTVTKKFDPNMIVILAIAVSNIFIGGFWGGFSKHKKYIYQKLKDAKRKERKMKEKAESGDSADDDNKKNDDDDDDDESVDLSLIIILIFFILVCGFLVLLYFFYDYLVYVVIGLFCIAGAMGLYYCLIPLWKRVIPLDRRIPPNRVPFFRDRPEVRSLLLMPLCMGLAIFWGIQRHASYAWVIQDILGFAFCINVMKTVHIPNLKICTVMLGLLFVYDIFFVFITPLFTKSGDSIMVKVATGGGSQTHEQLPMVFQVPRLDQDVISVCPVPMSLLGFGDIIIPGLLVSHNYAFDIMVKSRKVYYIASAIAYAIGLIITFIALALMKTGQPALLYLVPCTLGTTFLIGLKRKEVKRLWNGAYETTVKDSSENDATENTNNVSTTDIAGNETAINNSNSDSSSSVGSDSENKTLLRK